MLTLQGSLLRNSCPWPAGLLVLLCGSSCPTQGSTLLMRLQSGTHLETWEGSQEASELSEAGRTVYTVIKLELGRDQRKQEFGGASGGRCKETIWKESRRRVKTTQPTQKVQ